MMIFSTSNIRYFSGGNTMSILTDVKRKILELEGGAFQEFCDAFLIRKGYECISELGMQAGTMKTTIGNPDTYFRSKSGKYIFVAYTTQRNAICNKIKEDIDKCFDISKTGVNPSDIEEIVYCHTSSNITAGQDKDLHEICENEGVLLELYGIDRIANEVYYSYKTLARDMLGIAIDTNQVLELDDFILKYNSNEMAAPLSTHFQFREKESELILDALNNNKVVAVYGKAGAGKTRLVLEIAKRYQVINNCKLYCIKSNDLSIAQDLASYIENPGEYLVFVDDANELIGLKYVLEYLNKTYLGYNVKIIITVRDYAKHKVLQEINEFTRPFLVEIKNFTDDEIKQFLDHNMGIRNEDYVKQIIRIAEGNPRIAYMAGELAKEEQKLSSISNATQLYESYYQKYISSSLLRSDQKLCLTAGIISLLHTINIDKLDNLQAILDTADISKSDFINHINTLLTMEMIEVKYDKVAIITDQCLANYMLYFTFFTKRFVPFNIILDVGFKSFRKGIIKATNILWSIFNSQDIHDYLEKEINIVWDKYAGEQDVVFEEFLKVFHDFRPEESLLFIKRKIQDINSTTICFEEIQFEKNVSGVTDEILSLLSGYRYHKLLPEVMELTFEYIIKNETIVNEAFHFFTSYYSINQYSERYDYYTQKILISELVKHIDNDIICKMFIHLAKHFLGFVFNPAEVDRGNQIIMYRIPVDFCNGAKEYRKVIWENLLNLSKNLDWQDDILKILEQYSQGWEEETNVDILKYEIAFVSRVINSLLSQLLKGRKIVLAKICSQLMRKYKKFKLEEEVSYDNIFSCKEWKIYSLLEERHRDTELSYEEREKLRETKIREFTQELKCEEIKNLICILNEMVEHIGHGAWTLNNGASIIAYTLSDDYESLLFFLESYCKWGDKLDIYPAVLLKKFIDHIDAKTVYEWIWDKEFRQKNLWQFIFFEVLPSELINNDLYDKFLNFLKLDTDKEITNSSNRNLKILDKFLVLDPDVYCKASRIILEKLEYSKFIVHIYFGLLFNEHVYKPIELIESYTNDMPLLQNMYFSMLQYDRHEDHSGIFIANFVKIDFSWVELYADYIYSNLDNYHDDAHERFNTCWQCTNYLEIFDYIFDYIVEKDNLYRWRSKFVFSHMLIHEEKEIETAKRQREWIFHIIEKNCNNDKIYIIFEILSELGEDIRREALAFFISSNQDYSVFEKLALEANHWSWSGSLVPIIQRRKQYFESLLPYLTGINLLEHKKLIREKMKMCDKEIEREQVDEIFRELYD